MVVLSVAITTKTGKTIFARQFTNMTRLHIEGLIASFPKLITLDSQHTFIETDNIRYVYQPLETLYLLLITNKASNIMEDLDTLRLLTKLIPEYCQGNDETAIYSHLYELIFAFDEVISLGYRENVTISQIKTFTEMDSHEEKLQKIILESKMNEARDESNRRAGLIEKQKLERKSMESQQRGNTRNNNGSSNNIDRDDNYSNTRNNRDDASSPVSYVAEKPKENVKTGAPVKGMGMSLSKKKDTNFAEILKKEEHIITPVTMPTKESNNNKVFAKAVEVSRQDVRVVVDESINIALERDGSLSKMEVKGEMKLVIVDPDQAMLALGCSLENLDAAWKNKAVIKFQPHPKIDAKLWSSENKLALKDPSKPFPVGSENASGVLKWRINVSDTDMIPLSVNFWPSSESGRCVVSVEYSMPDDFLGRNDFVLNQVVFQIPCQSREQPDVTQIDGDYTFNMKEGVFLWRIDEITPGSNGTLEFNIPDVDNESFYPVNIRFKSDSTYCGININTVQHSETSNDIPFEFQSVCQTEKFVIE